MRVPDFLGFLRLWWLVALGVLALGRVQAGHAQAPTPRQVQNLETFARLYGYVRYFHPSDEAAAANWNSVALLGSQRVLAAQTTAELQATLLALFRPLAPTLQLLPTESSYRFKAKDITPTSLKGYQVISWQHQGMGQGDPRNIYRSIRLNRPEQVAPQELSANFGTLATQLDARPYRGCEFRYTAQVRNPRPGQGAGALWFRADLENQTTGFFDNMGDRPIAQTEWAEYEIRGKVDQQAATLVFGVMLHGAGQLQVDNLRLAMRDGNGWKTIFATGFEDDSTGHYPRSIASRSPADAQAIKGAYSYLVTEAMAASGHKCVTISSVAHSAAARPLAQPLFAQQAAIGEAVQEDIGSGLRCVLPLALYGTRTTTYPAADTAALAALQRQLKQANSGNLSGADRAVRLADIVIAWNVFQHFYPYFAVSNSHWAESLTDALTAAYPDQSGQDFANVLRRLTARLHDGHVRVTDLRTSQFTSFRLPIEWEWVQNQLVVTRVVGDSVALRPGDVITTINGQPAAFYFREAEQLISAATPGWLHYRAAIATTTGPRGEVLRVQVQAPSGGTRTVRLHHSLSSKQFEDSRPRPAAFRRVAPAVYYLNLDQLPMPELEHHWEELTQAQTIICDLRGYPKGNHPLLAHLLARPDTSTHWMRVPQVVYPNQQRVGFRPLGWSLQPQQPHLTARVIFIIDGRAISYAESYLSFVEHYHLATIIGQPTAGTNGNINPFTLPGQYAISWTGMEVRKHDGSQHHGVGIRPSLYLEKTIQGVRDGRDEFLEKALELATAP